MTNNKIQAYAERIERLLDERDGINADIKDIYDEVKSQKFEARALRAVIAERRKPTDATLEAAKEAYRAALDAPGATYRSVAEQIGISKSKLQRLVPREANGTTDPETGEIA